MGISTLAIITFVGLIISSLAKRIHFSSELLIVIIMGTVSFIPIIPEIQFEGHILLEIILPPLLFSAARNLSGYKFRKMRTPILYLGVALIFFTAFVVAYFVSTFVGFMSLSAGLILGAVVAPPDAVSSVSIGKRLGLPDRVMTILTGESLINDASALTLFVLAVSLTYHEESFIEHPLGLFAWTSAIGVLFGVACGAITLLTRKLLKEANLIAVFTAIVPFAAYVWTEHIHGSGVLAVVAAGFVVEKSTYHSSHVTRLQEQSLWRSLETMLDSFVFAYVGLQLRFILSQLDESPLDTKNTILFGVLVLIVVMIVRPIGVLGYNGIRLIWYRIQLKRVKHFVVSLSHKNKVETRLSDAPVSWREYIVLSWTGMRGVVTLAAASSVPLKLASDSTVSLSSTEFQIHIFIMVVGLIVAIGTLLLQGLTLPALIRKVLPPETYGENNPLDGQWGKARRLMEESALRVINAEYEADSENFDREHVIKVWKSLDSEGIGKNKRDISFVSQLLTEIVEAQRDDIQTAAKNGEIHPDVAKEYLDRLDYRLASFTHR
jgi:CPA1 family monovalent cation:H+ antiporter